MLYLLKIHLLYAALHHLLFSLKRFAADFLLYFKTEVFFLLAKTALLFATLFLLPFSVKGEKGKKDGTSSILSYHSQAKHFLSKLLLILHICTRFSTSLASCCSSLLQLSEVILIKHYPSYYKKI